MTKTRILALLVTLGALASTLATSLPADAQPRAMSLKDKKAWEANKKLVDDKARDASAQCGSTIVASIDVSSFKGWDPARLAPFEMCRDAVIAIGSTCSSPLGKSTVQKSVKTISCRRATDSSTGARITHHGSALTVSIEPTKAYVVDRKGGTSSWQQALDEVVPAAAPAPAPPAAAAAAQTSASAPADPAAGFSLRDRQSWESDTKLVEAAAKQATEECGTKITVALDIASFKGWDPARLAPFEMCKEGIIQLGAMCRASMGKSAVQQSVSTITCRRSTDPEQAARVSRQGKDLVFTIEPTKAWVTGKKGMCSWQEAFADVL